MTKNQLIKKADVARRYGRARVEDSVLYFHGDYFALYDKNNNCVDCVYNINDLFYICD